MLGGGTVVAIVACAQHYYHYHEYRTSVVIGISSVESIEVLMRCWGDRVSECTPDIHHHRHCYTLHLLTLSPRRIELRWCFWLRSFSVARQIYVATDEASKSHWTCARRRCCYNKLAKANVCVCMCSTGIYIYILFSAQRIQLVVQRTMHHIRPPMNKSHEIDWNRLLECEFRNINGNIFFSGSKWMWAPHLARPPQSYLTQLHIVHKALQLGCHCGGWTIIICGIYDDVVV